MSVLYQHCFLISSLLKKAHFCLRGIPTMSMNSQIIMCTPLHHIA